MSKQIVSYLKVAACGVAAFVLCACTRLSQSGSAALSQPRLGDPPVMRENLAAIPEADIEAHRLEALELAMAALDANIVELKRALEIMAPLPDQEIYYIAAEAPAAGEASGAGAARLYAIAPDLGRANSLFYEAELAAHPVRAAAQTGWRQSVANPEPVSTLTSFSGSDAVLSLTGDHQTGDAAVGALCVELAALSGPCGVTAPLRAYR